MASPTGEAPLSGTFPSSPAPEHAPSALIAGKCDADALPWHPCIGPHDRRSLSMASGQGMRICHTLRQARRSRNVSLAQATGRPTIFWDKRPACQSRRGNRCGRVLARPLREPYMGPGKELSGIRPAGAAGNPSSPSLCRTSASSRRHEAVAQAHGCQMGMRRGVRCRRVGTHARQAQAGPPGGSNRAFRIRPP